MIKLIMPTLHTPVKYKPWWRNCHHQVPGTSLGGCQPSQVVSAQARVSRARKAQKTFFIRMIVFLCMQQQIKGKPFYLWRCCQHAKKRLNRC